MQGKSSTPPPKNPGRASLPVVPPKGSPFAGISGTNAPARDTKIPALTAHVQLAKAQKQRLQNGGLLTAAQQKKEAAAAKVLAKTPAKNATPPAGAKRSAPESAPHPPTGLRGAPTPPKKKAPVTSPRLPASLTQLQPAAGTLAAAPARVVGAHPSQPVTQTASHSNLLGSIADAASVGLGTALSVASSVPRTLITPIHLGATHTPVEDVKPTHLDPALKDATGRLAVAGSSLATRIAQAGDRAGQINVDLLPAAQAKQFPGQKFVTEQQIRELEAKKGKLGTFPEALRHTLIEASVKNGWPREDVTNAVDSDLLHYWSNKPAWGPVQFAKNIGSFAARQASTPAGLVALGDAAYQAATGNTTLAKQEAQQFADGMRTGVPFLSKHGVLHDLYWHPGESVQNLSLGVGAADTVLGKVGKFAPDVAREVTPEGFAKPISRGTLTTKPLERGITNLRDAYVNSRNPVLNAAITDKRGEVHPLLGPASPLARRSKIAKQDYLATRDRAVAPTMAKSNQLRANVMTAAQKVGKERAAALLAHLQGVDPAERAAFYHQVSDELGGIKGRGAAAHAKLSERHPVSEATLTPKDQAFVAAVREAATFATHTRANAGQLDLDLAGRYRAYQAPIVVAAKSGDGLALRARELHKTWTSALANKAPAETLAPIADEFKQVLDDFTARHEAAGGTTPVYIPQEVPQSLTNAFRREASVTATNKVPNLKATQDKLFSSGQYRSTPQGVSLETHRAAVVQARIDHFKAVNEEYATKAVNGAPHDPNTVIVKAENLRSPVKLENTVGEHNLTDEDVHSTLTQLRHALETGVVKPVDGTIPMHGDYRVIPKSIYQDLHESTQLPKSGKGARLYDAANRKYLRAMLSKPSTGIANIAGNPILAMEGGASPLEATLGGYRHLKNPETLPPQLMGEGLAGVAGERTARTPFGKWVNFSLSHQRASEDAARAALYHHVVKPYVREQMTATGRSADEILKDLASGKDPNVGKFVKQVEDFLGSMKSSTKIDPGTDRFLGRSIMFHRWLGHILTLTLYTMPIKYPGRAVILQRIAEIGDDYRKHHGVYPSWYSGMIPLLQHVMEHAGVPGEFTRVIPTGSIWPTSNLPLPLADSEGQNPLAVGINAVNPVMRAAVEAPMGLNLASLAPYKDAQGNKIAPGLTAANAKLALGQLYRAAPYASIVTPMPGRSNDSFPGNMHNAVHKNKYGHPLPDAFGTTAIPLGGNTPNLSLGYAEGLLSRLALGGSGIQDLPANTVGTQYAQTAQLIKARQARNKMIREAAKARAKKP